MQNWFGISLSHGYQVTGNTKFRFGQTESFSTDCLIPHPFREDGAN